ncbi:MAG TPA: DUF1302 family protein [Polyangia bacterium]|nr:DUF1302 family protein [Polyangia bacterium]
MRSFALLTTLLVGGGVARVAHAQADGGAAPDAQPAGVAPPAAGGSPDAGAESGPGLFEQSNAAAAAIAAPETPAATPPFTLSGYVRGDMFGGKATGANVADLKSGYGELDLTVRTKKEPYGDGFAEARVRYGLQGDQTQGTVVELREAYVNAYLGPFDLRLGQQIVVWGRADALNPTNNLTPVDFRIRSPIEDDIRLANAGARAFLRFAPFRLEGVWMPLYLPTELPAVALPQYVSYGQPVFPSLNLRDGTEGARLHLELPAFELSFSYVHGNAPLPGLTMTGLNLTADANGNPGTTPPSILVSRTSYVQQVFGFDFSTALGEAATLRGEVAYRRPYDDGSPAVQDHHIAYPDLQYVLGADHTFGSLSVIVQYMGRYVLDWEKQNGPAMQLDPSVLPMEPMTNATFVTDIVNATLARDNQILFSQTARLQHLGTLRFEWLGLHETLSISSLCMLNVTTHEWLVTPRIGYRISDELTGYLGAQVFHGPPGTLFGLVDAELSAGYVELRYTF